MSAYAKYIMLAIVILNCYTVSKAQETDSIGPKKISLSVQPLFLITNAARLDMEIQHRDVNNRNAYLVNFELYAGELNDDGFLRGGSGYTDKISGFGIGLQQKYKFRAAKNSLYVNYGFIYRHQKLTYQIEDFYPYQQNGLNYFDYGPITKKKNMNTLQLVTTLGYQCIAAQHFLFDMFMGLGYRIPLNKIDFGTSRDYDDTIHTFASEGLGIVAGVKFGFQFK